MDKKRIANAAVAAGLSLSMVLTSVPVTALAEGVDPAAQEQGANTEAEAKYTTVTFMVGKEVYATAQYEVGKPLGEWKVPDPTKEGYKFYSWGIIGQGFFEIDTSEIVHEGMTLHARFDPVEQPDPDPTYQALFVANGGTFDGGVPTMSIAVGSDGTITQPKAPTREGYTFAGWSYHSDYNDPVDFTKPVDRNVTLFAQWTKNEEPAAKATVKFVVSNPADSSLVDMKQAEGTVGETVAVPSDLKSAIDGYTLSGWMDKSGKTYAADLSDFVVPADGTTLMAQYTKVEEPAPSYQALFSANGGAFDGGVETMSVAVRSDGTIPQPKAPTREGYTFVGWSFHQDGSDPVDFTKPVDKNVTLFAQWTKVPETYYAVYNANGGVFADGQPVMTTAIDSKGYLRKPLPPTREGYTFVGWSFHADNEELIDFTKPVEGKNVTAFAVWQKNAEKANLTIVATKPDTTELVYNDSQPVDVDGTAVVPEDLAGLFEGYTLKGFMDKSGKTYAADLSDFAMPAEDTVLYAMFEKDAAEQHYALFYANGGAFDGNVETMEVAVRSDGTIPQPKAPTREGYTFNGYSFHQDGSDPVDFTKPVDRNVTLFAQWTKNEEPAAKATVKFMMTNPETDEVIFDQTVETLAGKKVAFPTGAPAVEGYSLTGWMDQDGKTYQAALSDFVAPEGATTLYALWTKNATPDPIEKATVKFMVTNPETDEVIFETTVETTEGEKVSLPAGLPGLDGYSLDHWVDQNGNAYQVSLSDFVAPAGNTTLLAQWTKNATPDPIEKASVKFVMSDPADDTVLFDQTVETTEGSKVTLDQLAGLTAPEGYALDGWMDQDGNVYQASLADFTAPAGNTTMFALLKQTTPLPDASVKFIMTDPETDEIVYEKTITAKPGETVSLDQLEGIDTPEGWMIAGWMDQTGKTYQAGLSDFTVPAGATTMLAQLKSAESVAAASVKFVMTDPATDKIVFEKTVETSELEKITLDQLPGLNAPEGYVLDGWMDQTGKTYEASLADFVAPAGNTTMFALLKQTQPMPDAYVKFIMTDPATDEIVYEKTLTAKPGDTLTLDQLEGLNAPEGYVLDGWMDQTGKTYQAALSDFTVPGGATLMLAQLKEVAELPDPAPANHRVTLVDKANGTENTYEVKDGLAFGEPTDPTFEGYKFYGWSVNESGEFVAYDFSTPVTSDLTLYAWYVADEDTTTPEEPGDDTTTPDTKGDVNTDAKAEAKDDAKAPTAEPKKDAVPNTGDTTNTAAVAGVGLAGVLAAVAGYFFKRRNNE